MQMPTFLSARSALAVAVAALLAASIAEEVAAMEEVAADDAAAEDVAADDVAVDVDALLPQAASMDIAITDAVVKLKTFLSFILNPPVSINVWRLFRRFFCGVFSPCTA